KGEHDHLCAFKVEPGATELAVERERATHTLDRQLAGKREASVVPVEAERVRFECDLREALDVEEVGRAEMLIPLLVERVQAGGSDRGPHSRRCAGHDRGVE